MNEQIDLLLNLQELDIELDRLKEEAESIPIKISITTEQMTQAKQEIENKRKEIKQFQLKHKELDIELLTKESEIKKHKTELNAVKTNEQYRALLSEIANIEVQKNKIEDNILISLENTDSMNLEVDSKEKELTENEKKIQHNINDLNTKKEEIENKIKEYEEKRKVITDKIKPDILRKYEHIRDNREGIAIASIDDGSCGSCYMKLPAQFLNESHRFMGSGKFNDIVYCENCSRILLLKNGNKNTTQDTQKTNIQS